jgi:hypothetical protein
MSAINTTLDSPAEEHMFYSNLRLFGRLVQRHSRPKRQNCPFLTPLFSQVSEIIGNQVKQRVYDSTKHEEYD